MKHWNIPSLSNELDGAITEKIDLKTKPVGALGKLETIAKKICQIQETTSPQLKEPTIVVFAGDHGIAKQGLVNPYPQEVTYQMVYNFLGGGAAINVFAAQNNITVKVVDAGVNHDFGEISGLIDHKIAMGTNNYMNGPAMTLDQCKQAMQNGANMVEQCALAGTNIIGFGEMGIGNTSASSLIMSTFLSIPVEDCVGKGTGVNSAQLEQKIKTLKAVFENYGKQLDKNDPITVLAQFGGFEIAEMCGAMLRAAEHKMVILVDGFITTAALLVAAEINANVLDYCLFSHCSDEQGHQQMLKKLNADPIINLGMRLGEGSGVAVAYPLIVSACEFLNRMASFESASVSNK